MTDRMSGPPTRPSLLLRIRDPKDHEAWKTFIDVYTGLIWQYCRKRGLQDADAQNVTQEVLLQVCQSVRSNFEYQPERGQFRGYLKRITHSKICALRSTSQRRGAEMEGEAAFDLVESPEQDSIWDETFYAQIYRMALEQIRPGFEEATWRIFELICQEGRSAPEVADEVGMKINAVYQAKFRVIEKLQEKIMELAEDSAGFLLKHQAGGKPIS